MEQSTDTVTPAALADAPEPATPAADRSVAVEVPVELMEALRRSLEPVAPRCAVRLVVVEVTLRGPGGSEQRRIIDAVTDAEGNLVLLALGDRLHADQTASRAVDQALGRIGAWLDAHDCADRDATELVLDADGACEARVTFDLDIRPAEAPPHGSHDAIHGGAFHIAHRAPDLDALRDRLHLQRLHPVRRWLRTITGRD